MVPPTVPGHEALVVLACSGLKLAQPAPALELYRGVMYSTFRAAVMPGAPPQVVILSAKHGFLRPQDLVSPYDQRMSPARAQEMLANLDKFLTLAPRSGVRQVLLAGGKPYRAVMRAALPRLIERTDFSAVTVLETSGGLGYQRQQLRAFLSQMRSANTASGLGT